MQHAVLTTFEVLLIAFSVLRLAKGLSPIKPPPRPRSHLYPTFEFELPLKFLEGNSAVTVDLRALVPEAKREDYKLELMYAFCCGIKAFKSVVAVVSLRSLA